MRTRRQLLGNLLAGLVAGTTAALTGRSTALAAEPTIEVIALGHSPVRTALQPVRDFLAGLGTRVHVTELDAESPDGEKRVKASGLNGHVPVLLLINGTAHYKRPDGTDVTFVDFPANAGGPFGMGGSWTVDDFKAAVSAALGDQAPRP